MITDKEATRLINANLPTINIEVVALMDSLGKVLAEDVISPVSSPPYTNSAMDGFAVKWDNIFDNIDCKLEIIGESQAGIPYKGNVNTGQAIRINTGAIVPEEVDTVVPIEDCSSDDKFVVIHSAKKLGQHVRYTGEEFKKRDVLLEKNTIIEPAQIGLLSSVGVKDISVYQSPTVAVVVTGTELVEFDTSAEAYQLRDSNTPMLKAALRYTGVENISSYRVGDSLENTIDVLDEAQKSNQIIIVTGGVSVGLHDYVKEASKALGFTEIFWKVRQKPGKPFYFATNGNKLLFGLPGNPVSAYMGFIHYIDPIIRKLQKLPEQPHILEGRLVDGFQNKKDRTQFVRVKIEFDGETQNVIVSKKQGSHMLTSIAETDGYIRVDGKSKLDANKLVNVILFPGRV
ncbi:MAG: molybdopterin molybdotransferase MoeA [Candidatus Marinimicrobia bacterium]|nr:molybdopterin molybdotransferase MoeA [Candidatus Neomarinimicrobiota bacterium]MBL7023738.1 molybdopterin molybdotransferase MoeA [Candidatus Neomarinimicrobiota bacterium]MBL7109592.1 molybdopterin molybdotransferase MoeA [Candidatus Neomarinimicrobiota bacterium]